MPMKMTPKYNQNFHHNESVVGWLTNFGLGFKGLGFKP
jgi:hypothetical protein